MKRLLHPVALGRTGAAAVSSSVKRISDRTINVLFLLAVLLIVAAGAYSLHALRGLNRSADDRVAIQALDRRINNILIALLDLETSHRGFVLTGDPEFLAHRQTARQALAEDFALVRRRLGEDSVQQGYLTQLESLVGEKLALSERIVAARQTGVLDVAQQIIATEQGRQLTDQVRRIIGKMVAEQRGRLERGDTDNDRKRAQMQATLLLVLGGAVGFLLVAFGIYLRERNRLRQSEEKFARVIEASPSGLVMIGLDGRLLLANARVEELFGYPRAELLGQPVEMLVPERLRGAHPGHRASFFAQPSPRLMGADRELFGRRKDGIEVPVEIGLSPLTTPEGRFVLASIVDITERRQLTADRERLTADLDSLLQSTNEGIYGIDLEGRFTFINRAALGLLGYTRDEVIGRNAHEAIHHTHKDGSAYAVEECPIFQAFLTGQGCRIADEVLWRKDGGSFPSEYASSPILQNDVITGAVVIFSDITARKRAEAELVAAKHRAEASDRLKSAFLATMSHELRTPLNSIIGFTGIMQQGLAGTINDEQKRQLGMVMASSRHLLALINDVLDVSKIEAGELKVERRPFDARKACGKCVEMITPLAEKKHLPLQINLAPEVGELVSDPRRFEQIVINLLTNAVKFTERGSITLTARIEGPNLAVAVTDTGVGIAPDDAAKLFRPFHQVNGGLTRPQDGTGLGLSICQKLLGLMGGAITLQSTPGKGSTFAFTLPLKPVAPAGKPEAKPA